MYGEMLRIMDLQGEYRWSDVFPGLSVIATNAKDMMIGLGYERSDDMRFKTLEFSSIGSGKYEFRMPASPVMVTGTFAIPVRGITAVTLNAVPGLRLVTAATKG